ncbi:uncharacterized protein BO96DRAFT_313146, partial [Aspergillus niger CBS 101883]
EFADPPSRDNPSIVRTDKARRYFPGGTDILGKRHTQSSSHDGSFSALSLDLHNHSRMAVCLLVAQPGNVPWMEEGGGGGSNTEMTLDRTGLAPTSQLSCFPTLAPGTTQSLEETAHEGIQGPRQSQHPKLDLCRQGRTENRHQFNPGPRKRGTGGKGKNGCKDKQAVIADPGELNKPGCAPKPQLSTPESSYCLSFSDSGSHTTRCEGQFRYTAKAEAYGDSDRPCVAHVHGLSHASLTIRLSLARCAFARVARHNPTSPLDIYPGLSCHVEWPWRSVALAWAIISGKWTNDPDRTKEGRYIETEEDDPGRWDKETFLEYILVRNGPTHQYRSISSPARVVKLEADNARAEIEGRKREKWSGERPMRVDRKGAQLKTRSGGRPSLTLSFW